MHVAAATGARAAAGSRQAGKQAGHLVPTLLAHLKLTHGTARRCWNSLTVGCACVRAGGRACVFVEAMADRVLDETWRCADVRVCPLASCLTTLLSTLVCTDIWPIEPGRSDSGAHGVLTVALCSSLFFHATSYSLPGSPQPLRQAREDDSGERRLCQTRQGKGRYDDKTRQLLSSALVLHSRDGGWHGAVVRVGASTQRGWHAAP